MRILVLDGNENQAVACVRSLSRAGHEVHVGAETRWSKAGLSRHAKSTFHYPASREGVEALVSAVLDRVRPDTLILPMTERSTLALSAARDEVYRVGGHMVLPDHSDLLRAFDKQITHELAHSVGVPVPTNRLVANDAEARAAAEQMHFPVVLKPRSSEEVTSDGRTRTTGAPAYAAQPDEFMTAYRQMRHRCSAIVVQEFVRGTGVGYFALLNRGELRAEFAHRRLRDVRPTGSGSSLRESAPIDDTIREPSLRLLRSLNWHGVAMVEYRRKPDGTPVLIEVNGRFWNSLALAIHAGVDFPALLARMAEHGDVPAQTGYRTGVRARWLVGDLQHVMGVMAGPPAGFPGPFPGRGSTLIRVLKPGKNTRLDNFEWRDPLPELGDWLHFALRRLPAHFARWNGS